MNNDIFQNNISGFAFQKKPEDNTCFYRNVKKHHFCFMSFHISQLSRFVCQTRLELATQRPRRKFKKYDSLHFTLENAVVHITVLVFFFETGTASLGGQDHNTNMANSMFKKSMFSFFLPHSASFLLFNSIVCLPKFSVHLFKTKPSPIKIMRPKT